MEWKKLGFSEQILSPKRKVVSGFALGLGASLIVLTIVSFNTSFNVPMFRGFSNFGASNSSLASWSFSFSSTSSSTASPTNATLDFHDSADFKQGTEDGRVVDSTPQASLSGMDKDGDPLGIVLEKTHLGNTSEMVKNGSFTVDGGWIPETTHADASGTATKASLSNSNVEGMTSDMAILGNSSEMVNNGSSPGEEGTVIGKTGLGGNTSDGKIFVAEITILNATDFLERLRGKKLIFVGDSLNRNMWESMDYNCSVDFVNAPFLVQESSFKGHCGLMRKHLEGEFPHSAAIPFSFFLYNLHSEEANGTQEDSVTKKWSQSLMRLSYESTLQNESSRACAPDDENTGNIPKSIGACLEYQILGTSYYMHLSYRSEEDPGEAERFIQSTLYGDKLRFLHLSLCKCRRLQSPQNQFVPFETSVGGEDAKWKTAVLCSHSICNEAAHQRRQPATTGDD
ncbi:hypothetical protein CK203_070367 [Vitis vinifera]|uniref:Trichome birefringence-like C-terminal domain-containing protein n=1 Tax=Vitis vinifera TaxID=29760 RepID=A0A438E6B6_VITVI|nr:hypothetical protein CK203_070367 [Vitis vinifera]